MSPRETVADIQKRVRERRERAEVELRSAQEQYTAYAESIKCKKHDILDTRERDALARTLDATQKTIRTETCKVQAHKNKERRALENGSGFEWIRLRRRRPSVSSQQRIQAMEIRRRLESHTRAEVDTSIEPLMACTYMMKCDDITREIQYAQETEDAIRRLENTTTSETHELGCIDMTQSSDSDSDSTM